MLVTYELQMSMIAEWWKQLFGESEGKEGKASCRILLRSPRSAFTGQFVQEGKKVLFETILMIDRPTQDITFPSDAQNLDQMNYLSGKSVDWVNKMAAQGTPGSTCQYRRCAKPDPDAEGYERRELRLYVYFFFRACAMTVLLLDVNPYNQPGVEVYKKNMFRLLERTDGRS